MPELLRCKVSSLSGHMQTISEVCAQIHDLWAQHYKQLLILEGFSLTWKKCQGQVFLDKMRDW